jgi:hypothetical protein
MIRNAPKTTHEKMHASAAMEFIKSIENIVGSRFYGLENLTKKGEARTWAIAPRPPRKAIAAISGEGVPLPAHLIRRWCAKRHAWRTVDLSTVKKIWYRDPKTKIRHIITIME